MFDYVWQDREDQPLEFTPDYNPGQTLKKEKEFGSFYILLIPLFLFVGWTARDYLSRTAGVNGRLEMRCISSAGPFASPIQTSAGE